MVLPQGVDLSGRGLRLAHLRRCLIRIGTEERERVVDSRKERREASSVALLESLELLFFLLEIVGERDGREDERLIGSLTAWWHDGAEGPVNPFGQSLQVGTRSGRDDPVGLPAHFQLDRSTAHDGQAITRKGPWKSYPRGAS